MQKKFIPMLLSTFLVQRFMANAKTETRRLNGLARLNEEPNSWKFDAMKKQGQKTVAMFTNKVALVSKGYCFESPWIVGDVLWFRETMQPVIYFNGNVVSEKPNRYIYRADGEDNGQVDIKWKPSIFMPKAACRNWAKVTSVNLQRLKQTSPQSILKEGYNESIDFESDVSISYACDWWMGIWDSIYKEKAPFYKNPWVWVVAFERLEAAPDGWQEYCRK